MKITVEKVAFHRNGIAGTGFHAVLFDEGRGAQRSRKVAIVFPDRGAVAVLDMEPLVSGVIDGGAQRERGDKYESNLRDAVLTYEAGRASGDLLPEERRDLRYGRHQCVSYTRDGGLIVAENLIGTCVICSNTTSRP